MGSDFSDRKVVLLYQVVMKILLALRVIFAVRDEGLPFLLSEKKDNMKADYHENTCRIMLIAEITSIFQTHLLWHIFCSRSVLNPEKLKVVFNRYCSVAFASNVSFVRRRQWRKK